MKFRTEVEIDGEGLTLRPELPLLTVGSCFADNISGRMRRCLWDAGNPLGTLFNPLSILAALELSVFEPDFEDVFHDSVFEQDGITHSWLFDSRTSSLSPNASLNIFKRNRERVRSMLSKSQTLCVTFGTAFVYSLREDFLNYAPKRTMWPENKDFQGKVVANCHKQPSAMFTRHRVSASEIAELWTAFARRLKSAYPQMQIIFTVSPVRHVRDGLSENSRSKAELLLATDRICSELDYCHYFPAYEIVCDDLRDYRFYASDLVHPSETAVDYIWERFREAYIDSAGLEFLLEGESVYRCANHRPIMPDTTEAKNFVERRARLIREFRDRYPDSAEPAIKLT